MCKSMKKWLIAGAALILVGSILFVGVMTVLKWDFKKMSTVEYETNRYEVSEPYQNISIKVDTADVLLVPTEGTACYVECHELENVKHSVTVREGMLVIDVVDERKWYEHMGINIGTPRVTVYLPAGEYGTLSVKGSTGDVQIPKELSFASSDVSLSTGDVSVTGAVCTGAVKVTVSTGKTYMTDMTCKSLFTSGTTGDIHLKNVITSEKLSVKRSTGDVRFDSCDAAELYVLTDTGDVSGSLLSDKVFLVKTDTGDIDVPKTVSGGRCEITTDTGDIKITVTH